MPIDWQSRHLGELGELRNGVNFSRAQEGSGLPVLKVKDFGDLVICPLDGLDELDSSAINVPDDQLLAEDDIVIIRSNGNPALVGRSVVVKGISRTTTFSGFCIRFRPNRDVLDPRFCAYFLRSPATRDRLSQYGSGTGIQNLNQRTLAALPIKLPHIELQREIANVLASLDDKIEQNRRTSRALERLARAIFRAWFVDFEPVKAKADGATSFPSMPQPIFDALPTTFTDSEIGPIPEGWEVNPLDEGIHLTMGQSPPSEVYNEDGQGLPFHQGVKDYGFRFPTHRVYCTVDARLAEQGDVLLSVRAPVGRINVADRRLVLGRGLAGLRHRDHFQSFLLYQLYHSFAEEDAVGDGTIYKAVTKKFLSKMPTLSPAKPIVEGFDTLVRPFDELVATSETESRKLAGLRDYLLPKLLSGQVRVEVTNG